MSVVSDDCKAEEIEAAWAAHRQSMSMGDRRREWLRRHRERQNQLCYYCAVRFDADERDPMMRPTLDHVVPRVHGGEDSFENTVAACLLCNSAKDCMMPDEARTLLPAARVRILENRETVFRWRPELRYRW